MEILVLDFMPVIGWFCFLLQVADLLDRLDKQEDLMRKSGR